MLHDAVNDMFPTSIELAALATSVWSEPSSVGLGNTQRSVRESSTAQTNPNAISSRKTAIVIICVTYSTAITTYLAGVVTIAIPAISEDLHLSSSLVLWYVSA